MGRVGTAFKAFFRILGDDLLAERVRALLNDRTLKPLDQPTATPAVVSKPAAVPPEAKIEKKPPTRSEALTLLAVLQREARLIDFLKEDVSGYADDQIGAAVREIHRDAAASLDRMFALLPVRAEAEGATVTVPAGYDAGQIKLVGNVTGQPPHSGALVHAGWRATRVELPEWNGSDSSARVIAPAEVELR